METKSGIVRRWQEARRQGQSGRRGQSRKCNIRQQNHVVANNFIFLLSNIVSLAKNKHRLEKCCWLCDGKKGDIVIVAKWYELIIEVFFFGLSWQGCKSMPRRWVDGWKQPHAIKKGPKEDRKTRINFKWRKQLSNSSRKTNEFRAETYGKNYLHFRRF